MQKIWKAKEQIRNLYHSEPVGRNEKAIRYNKEYIVYKFVGDAEKGVIMVAISMLVWLTITGLFSVILQPAIQVILNDIRRESTLDIYSLSVLISRLFVGFSGMMCDIKIGSFSFMVLSVCHEKVRKLYKAVITPITKFLIAGGVMYEIGISAKLVAQASGGYGDWGSVGGSCFFGAKTFVSNKGPGKCW